MEHAVCVLKFGGTSVGSGERIQQVARVIAQARQEQDAFPVVVVSAMAGITDQLLRIARYACEGQQEEIIREFKELRQKHLDAAEVLVTDRRALSDLLAELTNTFSSLQLDIKALARVAELNQDVTLRTAAVAAYGERLSVLLVAAAVNEIGIAAEPIRQEIIITSHPKTDTTQPFGVVIGANPIPEETRANAAKLVRPLVERGIVPIAAGFLGRTITGFVTTLGRNGSDYSATVIGAALDCTEVTIFTDVDGVLTADPRQVTNARLLTHLSYAEAARLSWFGAKVLHPRTLIPIASRNIPVRVRNTFRPHLRGTVVGPVAPQRNSGARAITVKRNLALIIMESTDMFGAQENAGQVFELAARADAAPVAICSTSGQHLSFLVEAASADSILALLQHDMGHWTVRCRRNVALCACIGSGFMADPMSPARAVAALAHERIPVIAQGSSDLNITLVIEEKDSERALRSLHRDLIAPVIPLVRHSTQEKRREA
ncbi:aspartate kinase [Thermosporothrix hazakensis]|jgi:aspartate kinase|uniref:Aspartokinase n=2 Tax=Thermosporothrix TaxID=768650 RepID=A0A326UF43_THEHA|nr:aspartate kinase [Thermosporothrix hazakensis]PZW36654.1 aspartate kinase [Thermosporothrix hazakensis]BBH89121.1 aspartate kinase [Thermosporothrix sp. COM3]GCE47304.1 aspartate kinase [Thermosporothrix hazakensis]